MTTARKTAYTSARDGVQDTMKTEQEAYVKNLDQTVAFAKEQIEKVSTTFLKGFDEAHGYGRGNFDAVVKANTVAARGCEELGRVWFAFAQGQLEQGVSATRAMMTAKSIREVVDLQSDYAKTAFDTLLAEGARFSELSVKVTNEAIAPISERVNVTVEKFAKPVAA